MRFIATIAALLFSLALSAQNNIYVTTGVAQTVGAPTFTPGSKGAIVAIDTVTWDWYVSVNRNTGSWIKIGERLQTISGCAAPAYNPAKYQSTFVVNSCASPELYLHISGTTWACLNCASAGTNLSWSEVSSTLYRLNSSSGSDVFVREGIGATASLSGDTLTISASGGGGGGTVQTDATLDGDGSGGDPLKIAQQGATTSQVIEWTGATWEPSWGNPYTFVTTGGAITTSVNEILVGTVAANVTFGLPSCNATNDGKRFKFVRSGTDAFSMTIDPSSTETFYDGAATKTIYGAISIDCTCRWNGTTGVWFYDNF